MPSLLTAFAVALAFACLAIDLHLEPEDLGALGWVYSGGAEGARGVLSAIAASMITVAGVVFSVVIVALTLASQQFGPRLLRRFLRDRGNQYVVGAFVAIFVYCLLVLRTVRGEDHQAFVPNLAVSVAVLLAALAAGVLIYFIHHSATSLQASAVLAALSEELCRAIDQLFPEEVGSEEDTQDETAPDLPATFEREAGCIAAPATGYLLSIDTEALLETARRHDLLVRMEYRPGDFVLSGSALARVWPDARVSDEIDRCIVGAVLLGSQRTLEQDARFVFDQIVEMAVRALSPSTNDPFTAVECIDHLSDGLRRLAGRRIPSPYRLDSESRLRVIAAPATFAEIVRAAFGLISQHGRTHALVILRLIAASREIAPCLLRSADRTLLLCEASRAAAAADEALPKFAALERDAIRAALDEARKALAER